MLPSDKAIMLQNQKHPKYLECSAPSLAYYLVLGLTYLCFILTLPFSLFFCIKIVHEYKRMVVFRLGRLLSKDPLGPGVILILPCIDSHTVVDLRTMSYDVPSQEMLTKDSVSFISFLITLVFKYCLYIEIPGNSIGRCSSVLQNERSYCNDSCRLGCSSEYEAIGSDNFEERSWHQISFRDHVGSGRDCNSSSRDSRPHSS